jgi:hypothetical protein
MNVRKPLRWQAHPVARIPHGYQVAVADVNGDGLMDILALSSEESIVEWYESPSWKAHPVTTHTRKNISLAPLRRNGFGLRGLALATDFALEESTRGGNIWWVEPPVFGPLAIGANMSGIGTPPSAETEWQRFLIARIPTSHRLRWADLDGDGRPELVDAPIVGYGAKAPDYRVGAPLTMFEVPQQIFESRLLLRSEDREWPWRSHLIDDSLTVLHGINVLDWDGDGRDEILTASFEGVHLFHSTGRGQDLRWTKIHLAAGEQVSKSEASGGARSEVRRGSSEIGVGKVAGRRFLATIEPWHGEEVVVYFEGEPGQLWHRHVIDSGFHDGHALACADLDGDGNDEIVAGFRGPGTSLYVYAADSLGLGWERQTLDTEMAASGVVIADLDGDGRLDVVAIGASTGNVKWYENLSLRQGPAARLAPQEHHGGVL